MTGSFKNNQPIMNSNSNEHGGNRQKEPLETSDGQKNSDNGEHNFDFVYPDSDIEKTFYENKSSSDIGNQKEKKSLFGGLFKKKTVKTEKKPIFGKKTEVVEEEI